MNILVLDAMGVIYSVGDDVRDLLCPFIAEKGGSTDTSKIEKLYHSASLGYMSAFEFWKAVDVNPELEDVTHCITALDVDLMSVQDLTDTLPQVY